MKLAFSFAAMAALAAAPLAAHPSSQDAGLTQGQAMNHQMMDMKNSPANPYAEAEMRMHERMMSAMGANADETWARKMIEHHRGAIETGQILISKGGDAQLKAMARKSMAEQRKEINELQAWLKRHRKSAQ